MKSNPEGHKINEVCNELHTPFEVKRPSVCCRRVTTVKHQGATPNILAFHKISNDRHQLGPVTIDPCTSSQQIENHQPLPVQKTTGHLLQAIGLRYKAQIRNAFADYSQVV